MKKLDDLLTAAVVARPCQAEKEAGFVEALLTYKVLSYEQEVAIIRWGCEAGSPEREFWTSCL